MGLFFAIEAILENVPHGKKKVFRPVLSQADKQQEKYVRIIANLRSLISINYTSSHIVFHKFRALSEEVLLLRIEHPRAISVIFFQFNMHSTAWISILRSD